MAVLRTDLSATSLALAHLTVMSGRLVQNSSTNAFTASWTCICDPGAKARARLTAMGFPMAPSPINPTDVGSVSPLDADEDMIDFGL